MKTISKILNREFDFVVNHLGLFVTDELHIRDKYVVFIDGQDFEYSCGIGFRVPILNIHSAEMEFQKVYHKTPKKTKSNLLLYIGELKRVSKPKPLNIDDVLYSLVIDCQFSSQNFDDFCDDLGYDSDSIKAYDIYRACQKNSKKVRTFIKDLSYAIELFQDY